MSGDNALRTNENEDWTFIKESPLSHIHGLHSYPARMHPPVARRLIKLYASEGNLVLDPFCGSGGVLSEALIQGCNCVGIDINPLACLISRAKTTIIKPETLELKWKEILNEINKTLSSPQIQVIRKSVEKVSVTQDSARKKSNPQIEKDISDMLLQFNKLEIKLPNLSEGNLFFWFKPKSIVELAVIKHHLDKIQENKVREFFYVCFSYAIRDVSGTRNDEFKLYRIEMPKWEVYDPNALSSFSKKVLANIKNMEEFNSFFNDEQQIGQVTIINSDSKIIFSDFKEDYKKILFEEKGSVIKGKVNLIVTSPPYGDSGTTVAYGQYSRYSSFWLGYKKEKYLHVDRKSLGGEIVDSELRSDTLKQTLARISQVDGKRAKEVKSFYVDFNSCLNNFYKILTNNGKACFVVGNRTVKRVKIPTDEIITELGESIGFKKLTAFHRNIPNKRMPLRNSPTNEAGVNENTMVTETIVVLEKI